MKEIIKANPGIKNKIIEKIHKQIELEKIGFTIDYEKDPEGIVMGPVDFSIHYEEELIKNNLNEIQNIKKMIYIKDSKGRRRAQINYDTEELKFYSRCSLSAVKLDSGNSCIMFGVHGEKPQFKEEFHDEKSKEHAINVVSAKILSRGFSELLDPVKSWDSKYDNYYINGTYCDSLEAIEQQKNERRKMLSNLNIFDSEDVIPEFLEQDKFSHLKNTTFFWFGTESEIIDNLFETYKETGDYYKDRSFTSSDEARERLIKRIEEKYPDWLDSSKNKIDTYTK